MMVYLSLLYSGSNCKGKWLEDNVAMVLKFNPFFSPQDIWEFLAIARNGMFLNLVYS